MMRNAAIVAAVGLVTACGTDSEVPTDGGSDGACAACTDSGGGDASIDATLDATSDASADAPGDGNDGAVAAAFQLTVGENNTCVVFPDAKAKCWGENYVGFGLTHHGNAPNTMGANLPYLDFNGATLARLHTAARHTCAVFANGQVRCFGASTYGELGTTGTTYLDASLQNLTLPPSRTVVQVALGWTHSCFRFDDGSVRCIGDDTAGELGQGDTTPRTNLGAAVAVDLGTGRKAKDLQANGYFTCAILDDDRLKCWGSNSNALNGSGGIGGNLATGDNLARGDKPNQMGDALPYAALGNAPSSQPWKVKKVALGFNFACAILENDRLKCWGRNDGGILGTGDTVSYGQTPQTIGDAMPFVKVGTTNGQEDKVLDVAGSRYGICAIVEGGGVKCWGPHVVGGLADGIANGGAIGDSPAEMGDALAFVALGTGRTAKVIRAQEAHFCVVLDDDGIKCWGFGAYGQLGQGDTSNRGDQPNQMGDALPKILLQ